MWICQGCVSGWGRQFPPRTICTCAIGLQVISNPHATGKLKSAKHVWLCLSWTLTQVVIGNVEWGERWRAGWLNSINCCRHGKVLIWLWNNVTPLPSNCEICQSQSSPGLGLAAGVFYINDSIVDIIITTRRKEEEYTHSILSHWRQAWPFRLETWAQNKHLQADNSMWWQNKPLISNNDVIHSPTGL